MARTDGEDGRDLPRGGDLVRACPDEVGQHVFGNRIVGGEADGPFGEVEVAEAVPDGVDRRGTEREDAQVRLCGVTVMGYLGDGL